MMPFDLIASNFEKGGQMYQIVTEKVQKCKYSEIGTLLAGFQSEKKWNMHKKLQRLIFCKNINFFQTQC